MKSTTEQTTMICLFHEPSQADAAVRELVAAGVQSNSIGIMSRKDSAANPAAMDKWGVPQSDRQMLADGINEGGTVIALTAPEELAGRVQDIFERHEADKVDEAETPMEARRPLAAAQNLTSDGDHETIDVIEEQLQVGKREVQRGGVRVFQRITEKPVSETITLRKETVQVDRHPVNRAATAEELENLTDHSFQVTESNEEAVVSKSARVVEEVRIGKETTHQEKRIQETLRKTDVTVEQIEPEEVRQAKAGNS